MYSQHHFPWGATSIPYGASCQVARYSKHGDRQRTADVISCILFHQKMWTLQSMNDPCFENTVSCGVTLRLRHSGRQSDVTLMTSQVLQDMREIWRYDDDVMMTTTWDIASDFTQLPTYLKILVNFLYELVQDVYCLHTVVNIQEFLKL